MLGTALASSQWHQILRRPGHPQSHGVLMIDEQVGGRREAGCVACAHSRGVNTLLQLTSGLRSATMACRVGRRCPQPPGASSSPSVPPRCFVHQEFQEFASGTHRKSSPAFQKLTSNGKAQTQGVNATFFFFFFLIIQKYFRTFQYNRIIVVYANMFCHEWHLWNIQLFLFCSFKGKKKKVKQQQNHQIWR